MRIVSYRIRMQEGFNMWKGRKCIQASFRGRSTQDFHTEWTGTDCFLTRAEIPTGYWTSTGRGTDGTAEFNKTDILHIISVPHQNCFTLSQSPQELLHQDISKGSRENKRLGYCTALTLQWLKQSAISYQLQPCIFCATQTYSILPQAKKSRNRTSPWPQQHPLNTCLER